MKTSLKGLADQNNKHDYVQRHMKEEEKLIMQEEGRSVGDKYSVKF